MLLASSTLYKCIRSCTRVQLASGSTNLFSAHVQLVSSLTNFFRPCVQLASDPINLLSDSRVTRYLKFWYYYKSDEILEKPPATKKDKCNRIWENQASTHPISWLWQIITYCGNVLEDWNFDILFLYLIRMTSENIIILVYCYSKLWFVKVMKLDVCGSLVFSNPVTNI